jgi:upstream activation factor subunit UAF30
VPKTTKAKAEAVPPKKRTAGGLSKPVKPSAELAAIVGADPLPRTDVVSKIWAYIREHGLQDLADKRTIVADDKLKAVLGKHRATMFELNKLLSPHLSAA